MVVGIIGLGLIGGSIAKDIKRKHFSSSVIGYSRSKINSENALKLNLVHEIVTFEKLCQISDLIILSIPVNEIIKILPIVLDLISNKSVVIDVGSTKEVIISSIKHHIKRKRFVASHPMSGTENSGPYAAVENLFLNKVAIICNQENSDFDAVKLVSKFYLTLGSRIVFMNSKDHDEYVGYISHLPHIISYALAVSILEKEKSTSTIFDLASSGFSSTVRLAKSSPNIWIPIFEHNMQNLLPIIEIYIDKLNEFKTYLKNKDFKNLSTYISNANQIRKVFKEKKI